jgi:hypothetical protein
MPNGPPILPYPDKAPRRGYALPRRLIAIGLCFVPCWLTALSLFVFDPGLWDNDDFNWFRAWAFMVTVGTYLGLFVYAVVLTGILLRRTLWSGRAANAPARVTRL